METKFFKLSGSICQILICEHVTDIDEILHHEHSHRISTGDREGSNPCLPGNGLHSGDSDQISGGNRGICFQAATSLIHCSSSNHVILGCRDLNQGEVAMETPSSLPDLKGTMSVVQLDLKDDASFHAAVASIEASYDRLDVLVNSAFIFKLGGPRIVAGNIIETNVFGYIIDIEAFLLLLHEEPPRD
ncbi:hypothetical protein QQS21_006021 [Conoideocrella luteorostrata]|uniref:Uncharacterized protein n=1 Tax=Conoideocrella luteorostrata TaxID=1105319 RepID=A0AAJ0CSN0_9HYPO|nr:hypothetical protein QQS21_006021 [Conoideocrella luteorostrata]